MGDANIERCTKTSVFDNDVTILYKYCCTVSTGEDGNPQGPPFMVPSRLVVHLPLTETSSEDWVNLPTQSTSKYLLVALPIYIIRYMGSNTPLATIYNDIKHSDPGSDINPIDVLSTYILLNRETNRNADWLGIATEFYRNIGPGQSYSIPTSANDLSHELNNWEGIVVAEWRREMKTLDNINAAFDFFKNVRDGVTVEGEPPYPVLYYSAPSIRSTLYEYRPRMVKSGIEPTEIDGLDIFNQIRPSMYVPFVQYVGSENVYSWVYEGTIPEETPPIDKIAQRKADSGTHVFHITVWLGDPAVTPMHLDKKSNFFSVEYKLTSNRLLVNSSSQTESEDLFGHELARDRIAEAFSDVLVLGNGSELDIGGSYTILMNNTDTLEPCTFLDIIFTYPEFNTFFYIEEAKDPFALKKRIDLHYRSLDLDDEYIPSVVTTNPSAVSVTIKTKTSPMDQQLVMYDITGVEHSVNVPTNTLYTKVQFSHARSMAYLAEFTQIFNVLVRYYFAEKTFLVDNYSGVGVDVNHIAEVSHQLRSSKIKNAEDKVPIAGGEGAASPALKLMRKMAPGLFEGPEYPRQCVGKNQPKIVESAEERAQWLARGRTIHTFPHPNDNTTDTAKLDYVCPADKYPYLGLKCSNGPRRDVYPYTLCCYEDDQMGKNSKIVDYYGHYQSNGNIPLPDCGKKVAKAASVIVTSKFLNSGGVAQLPTTISRMFSGYNGVQHNLYRYGTVRSANSLIHCVLDAVNDPNYMRLNTEDLREQYASSVRAQIVTTVHLGVTKQELYDLPDTEIVRRLTDNTLFFDPTYYYRVLEEMFNINIFVLELPANKLEGGMIVPRHFAFHARPYRPYRQNSILVVRNKGAEANAGEYPQCELIVELAGASGYPIKVFPDAMTQLCYRALSLTSETLTLKATDESCDVRRNVYSLFDYNSIFAPQAFATSQVIDKNGKLRAVTYQFNNANGVIRFSASTIPSQPLNLPIENKLYYITFQDLRRLFSVAPSSLYIDHTGRVGGVWLPFSDFERGMFIFTLPFNAADFPELAGVDTYGVNPFKGLSTNQSITKRMKSMKRTLNIVTQILKWLYDLSKVTDVNQFVSNYVQVGDFTGDSSSVYDLQHIGRILPAVSDIQTGLRYISERIPTLVMPNGNELRVYLYNDTFYAKVWHMLQQHAASKTTVNVGQGEVVLKGYYTSVENFKQQPGVKLFIGVRDLDEWISSKRLINSGSYKIHKTILADRTGVPYVYQMADGRLYIIQNILERYGVSPQSGILRALDVAHIWYQQYVNVGPNRTAQPIDPRRHLIYKADNSGTVSEYVNNTQGDQAYLEILFYPSTIGSGGTYAAMLRVL